jgi:hypothetical protein
LPSTFCSVSFTAAASRISPFSRLAFRTLLVARPACHNRSRPEHRRGGIRKDASCRVERRNLERYSISGNFFGIRGILFPDRDGIGLSASQRRGDNGWRRGEWMEDGASGGSFSREAQPSAVGALRPGMTRSPGAPASPRRPWERAVSRR